MQKEGYMRIISDLTGIEYKTVAECESADKAYLEKMKAEKAKKEEELQKNLVEKAERNKISLQKKELSNRVESAREELDKALEEYEEAKKKAQKIVEDARKQAREVLEPSEKKIAKCKEDKYKALVEFNNRFGAYNVKYTGENARKEYDRWIKEIDSSFDDFFKNFLGRSIWF